MTDGKLDSTPLVRPVRASDKEEVLRFCAKTWGDGDYIPYVFDAWLVEPQGAFLAVELDGKAAGICKITELAPGEVWLEGLRVDPEKRGAGLSWVLSQAALRTVETMHPHSVRYSTGHYNKASQYIGAKMGLRIIAHYRELESAHPVPLPKNSVQWVPAREESALRLLARDRHPQGAVLARGWVFQHLTPAVVRELIERGQLFEAQEKSGRTVGLAAVTAIHGGTYPVLGYLYIPLKYADAAAGLLWREAKRLKLKEAGAMLPRGRLAMAVWRALKTKDKPFKVLLLDRPITTG